MEGVSASVNLATEKAMVRFNPEMVTLEAIKAAIVNAGLRGAGVRDSGHRDAKERRNRRDS